MFKYPQDLVELIKIAWKKNKIISDYIEQLPDDYILKNLLEISYHSSFMTEETRKVRFSLIFCPRDDESINNNYQTVHFTKSRDFSLTEIFRLAPATDPTSVLIGVDFDEHKNLKIWGLVDIGTSWRNFISGESGTSFLPPGFFTILSTEPGNLTISCAGITILDLRQGQIFKPTSGIFNEGLIADFFKNTKENIYKDLLGLIDSEYFDSNKAIIKDFMKNPQLFLERILFQIREKFTGGMIIILPDDYNEDDNRLKDNLMIKYPCNYNKIWKKLLNKILLNYKMFELIFSDDMDEQKNDVFHEYMFLQDKLKRVELEIQDTANFISSLSEVDGAIVITDKLRLLGFGAEVTIKTSIPSVVKIANDRDGVFGNFIPIDSYGTRHRAAFRFCYGFENSLIFVISQDGSLRAIKKDDDDLVLWQDLGLFNDNVINS
ncbi:MAG TPA: diadenylate cyclase [Spirochaetota bacterium]|nr:diadenylate cyclase [Spirochaetota bacterium]